MDPHHLVEMANEIGHFHEAFADRAEGLSGVAMHLRRFWDPRMRRALLAHIDEHGGAGLDPFVAEAIAGHRAELIPRAAKTA
jgi:formate dehydrogenase subunit delta